MVVVEEVATEDAAVDGEKISMSLEAFLGAEQEHRSAAEIIIGIRYFFI